MHQIPINYYPLHRSGCSLRRDAEIDAWRKRDERAYGPIEFFGTETITIYCGFGWDGIKDLAAMFQLFTVEDNIDYNSFNSLN